MNYYKYNKYKNKYLEFKKKIYLTGGYETCPKDYPKNSSEFKNTDNFSEIGSGIESKVYIRKTEPNIAYKVMKIVQEQTNIQWGKKSSDIRIQHGGVVLSDFINKSNNYEKASDEGLGPTFITSYKCNDIGVIIMQRIHGDTILYLKEHRRYNNIYFDEKLANLIKKLKEHKIIQDNILADIHDGNFMIETSTNKIYGIDF